MPDRLDEHRALCEREYSFFQIFAAIFSGSFAYSVSSFYEVRAQVYAARAAIAIQELYATGVELPERLEEMPVTLIENWPIDPFSRDSMLYRRMDDGFIVYSVGTNFEDDGGRIRGSWDTGFQVLR